MCFLCFRDLFGDAVSKERTKRHELLDLVAMRNELRTVGELYDLICERGLPHIADYL